MKKKYIIGVCCIIIISLGFVSWGLKLQFWLWETTAQPASAKAITNQLAHIQNITGQFFQSPWSLPRELQSFASAKQEIDLRTYDFTENTVKTLFKQLAKSGVQIHIILENQKFQQYQNTFKIVQQGFTGLSTIQMKSDKQMKTEYMHAKVNLIDDTFIIQTANLNHSSFTSNREDFFQSSHSWVRTSLHNIFLKDREGKPLTMKDIHPNLVICNINCRGVIQQLLASATQSIIIQTQYIVDPEILQILQSKSQLPEFKLLVADVTSNDNLLTLFDSEHARKFQQYYNHTKMILIDHKILLLGSMNLSAESLDKNREIWILLTEPTIISQFTWQFTKDWNYKK